MHIHLIDTTLSSGEEYESSFFTIPDDYAHHSIFTTVTGTDPLITAVVKSAISGDNTCAPDDETIFSNVGAGKRRDIVALDPSDWASVKFRNDGSADAYVRSWFCMKK